MKERKLLDKLYLPVEVWGRTNDGRVIIYSCFQVLPDNTFHVQSADFVDPDRKERSAQEARTQRLELFLEELPDKRTSSSSTLAEAIQKHQTLFNDFADY